MVIRRTPQSEYKMVNKKKIQARKDAARAIRIICEASQRLVKAQEILLEKIKKTNKT